MESGGGGGSWGEDFFEPSPAPESAERDEGNESLNALRTIVLLLWLRGAPPLERETVADLEELGFPDPESVPFAGLRREPLDTRAALRDYSERRGEDRVATWTAFADSGRADPALGFLVEVLASPLERESVAAAGALRRFLPAQIGEVPTTRLITPYYEDLDNLVAEEERRALGGEAPLDAEDLSLEWVPERWQETYAQTMDGQRDEPLAGLLGLVEYRLALGVRSPDPITRSLANAALLAPGPLAPPEPWSEPEEITPRTGEPISTMVHGTWAWEKLWWRPQGDFHQYVRGSVRPDLFSGGARFSWSGALSGSQRRLACRDLAEWAAEIAPAGLHTIFGHSYGGEVAACAVPQMRAPVQQLVLLSTPVTGALKRAIVESGTPTVDIRLPADPVLILAGTWRQRLKLPPVKKVVLRWSLNHSVTHDPDTWKRQNIAARAGL